MTKPKADIDFENELWDIANELRGKMSADFINSFGSFFYDWYINQVWGNDHCII